MTNHQTARTGKEPATPGPAEAQRCYILRGGQGSWQTVTADDHPANPHDLPTISCLMVTKNRFELAQWAMQCFAEQTYPNTELVIIDDGEDTRLEEHVAASQDENIRLRRLPDENKSLGELRNLALETATGSYVCQWDDDDLVDPERLARQMAVIRQADVDACFLLRWLIWWPHLERFALSQTRIWEGSMVCRKEIVPPYPTLRRGEDSVIVSQMLGGTSIALLDQPLLYTYIVHGRNTWDLAHFDSFWKKATHTFEGAEYEHFYQQHRQSVPLREYAGTMTPERSLTVA